MNKVNQHAIIATYFKRVTNDAGEVVTEIIGQLHRATILDHVKDLVEMAEDDTKINVLLELRAILTTVDTKISEQSKDITEEIEQLLAEAAEPYLK